MKDYYRILGISSDAEKATIRGAYRELALKYYKTAESGGAADNHYLADLAEAYEVLVDDKKRSEYDRIYFGGSSETGEEVDPETGGLGEEDQESIGQEFSQSLEKLLLQKKIAGLSDEIAKSGSWTRFVNRKKWKTRATVLEAEYSNLFPGEECHELSHIKSNRWNPPFVPVFFGLVAVGWIGVAIFWSPFDLSGLFSDETLTENQTVLDYDLDGVPSDRDINDSTEWISTRSGLPLKHYVKTDGDYDLDKLKYLLYDDCNLNDYADVELLKKWCKAKDVYVFNNKKYIKKTFKLYECSGVEVTDRSFMNKILAANGDLIEYLMVPDITDRKTKYKVPVAVVSDTGVESKDGARWRYDSKSRRWQKLSNKSVKWHNRVHQRDLDRLCAYFKWEKKINTDATRPNPKNSLSSDPRPVIPPPVLEAKTAPEASVPSGISNFTKSEVKALWEICGYSNENYCSNRSERIDNRISRCFNFVSANREYFNATEIARINVLKKRVDKGCN